MGRFKDENKNNPIVCYLVGNGFKYNHQIQFDGYERRYGATIVSINLEQNKIAFAHQSWNDDIAMLDGEVEMIEGWKNSVEIFIKRVDNVLTKIIG